MNAFIYAYTMCLILVCFAAALLSLAAFAVSRRRALLPQVAFFCFYIIEIASILGLEFVSQNLPYSVEGYYEVTVPALRVLCGAAILQSLWMMLLQILDVHDRMMLWVPIAVFVVACVAVLALMPYGALRQWCFYTLRQVFTAFGLGFALLRWHRSKDGDYRQRLARFRNEYVLLWVLLACVLAEDSFVILLCEPPMQRDGWLMLYLSERNFSENVVMLFVAYHSIRASVEALMLRFSEPPVAQEGGDLTRHVGDKLPAFAAAHGLSAREREVLALVMEGKDNRAIAGELYLSEGTIKTHVHNIMVKVGVKGRDALRQAFWSE